MAKHRKAPPKPAPVEVELKLALPTSDPAGLAQRLARVPMLAACVSTVQVLENRYVDTPDGHLQAARMALRLRRVGSAEAPQWLQTFKTADAGNSALSQRGEWEHPVPGPALDEALLRQAAPWKALDPEGRLFAQLLPRFGTAFERRTWVVRPREGVVIEVALDIGEITADADRAPLCELELELREGPPEALFTLARHIAREVAVWPLAASKAQRGHALRAATLYAPRRAHPPAVREVARWADLARPVLAEALAQCGDNLHALRFADTSELVHQARVGWRRFRSLLRLVRPLCQALPPPQTEALPVLWGALGRLRDLDVARTETLPRLQAAYLGAALHAEEGLGLHGRRRLQDWAALTAAFDQAAAQQRLLVRQALQTPAVGADLLALWAWLESLNTPGALSVPGLRRPSVQGLRRWTRQRVDRLHRRWREALRDQASLASQHRARILAKQLRYAIEALQPLLPGRAQDWREEAADWQQTLGEVRDSTQAALLAQGLEVPVGALEFLRGRAAARLA